MTLGFTFFGMYANLQLSVLPPSGSSSSGQALPITFNSRLLLNLSMLRLLERTLFSL